MERSRSTSLALLAGAAIWAANACTRASEDELLRDKLCSTSADCVSGYVCSASLGVCVRPGFELATDRDDNGDVAAAQGGAPGATEPGAAGAAEAGSAGATDGAGSAGDTANAAGAGGSDSGGASASGSGGISGSSSGGASGSGAIVAEPDGGTSDDPDAGTTDNPDASGSSDAGPSGNGCEPACSSGYHCVDSACVPASWSTTSSPPPELVARQQAAYAVAGSKLLIWGGVDSSGVNLSTGAIYDALQDTWQLTSVTANTPTGRVLANAAWTGSQFLVWGGRTDSGSAEFKTGALYDPATQIWTPTVAAATARSGAIPYSYSAQVVTWGGWSRTGVPVSKSDRYTVAGNTWAPAANDVLGKREHVGAAGSGSQLYIIAGRSDTGTLLGTTAVYDMGTNGWTAQPSLPAVRFGLFAGYSGAQLWVWGGRDNVQATGSGLLLGATSWTATASQGEPSARWAPQRQSGWTCTLQDGRIALVGGHDFADAPQRDGGIYDPIADAWAAIPDASETHEWGVGVCVNGELLLWGGSNNGSLTATGERWAP